MRSKFIFLCIVFGIGFVPASANAAQLAEIEVVEAEVYSQPTSSSDVLGTLKRGARIAVSNLPTQGFYKVRLEDGALGWISGEAIRIGLPRVSEPAVDKPFGDDGKSSVGVETDSTPASGPKVAPFQAMVFGGWDFFSLDNVAQVTGFNESAAGFYYGAAFRIPTRHRFLISLRLEQIRKVSTVRNASTTDVYQFATTATPFSAGIVWPLESKSNWKFSFSGHLGLSFSNSFTSSALTRDEPNETSFSGSAFTAMGTAEVQYDFVQGFGLLAEVGYRYLATGDLLPEEAGNGSEIFRSGAKFAPISINLSGFFVGGGIVFKF